jgi:hypothetical protein
VSISGWLIRTFCRAHVQRAQWLRSRGAKGRTSCSERKHRRCRRHVTTPNRSPVQRAFSSASNLLTSYPFGNEKATSQMPDGYTGQPSTAFSLSHRKCFCCSKRAAEAGVSGRALLLLLLLILNILLLLLLLLLPAIFTVGAAVAKSKDNGGVNVNPNPESHVI